MKRRITLLAITCLTIIGSYKVTTAQCNLDQSQLLTNGGRSARNLPGAYEGQSFTVGFSGNLCKIEMLMFNYMSGTGTLKIYAGSGISGTLLTSQIVSVYVPSGSVWQQWTIASPPPVTSGSTYTFQFIPTQGGGLPDPYGVNVNTGNVYSGGYDITNPTGDLAFKVHVDDLCSISASISANSATTFCQGGNVLLSSSKQGSPYTYKWLHNGNQINGATNFSYNAYQSGNYSLLLDSLGCKDTSNVIFVIVNPLPVVSINPVPPFINYTSAPLSLSGIPSGGTFGGNGIIGNNFYPNLAGLGSHLITYSYTDGNSCSNTTSASTIVYDTTGIICTVYDTVTTHINIFDTTHIIITDTNHVNIFDTIYISVTDTLIIHALLTGMVPPNNTNTIKIYPNPASTHIYIDNGAYTTMVGYQIKINNSIGQTVFSSFINQQQFYVDLSLWSGNGIYFVYIIDHLGNTIETRKILLQ